MQLEILLARKEIRIYNRKYVFLQICSGHTSNRMRKASESLGSFLALDCKWMRGNPQSPGAREPAHPVELSNGKGGERCAGLSSPPRKGASAPSPSPCLRDLQRLSAERFCYFMHLLKQRNSFSSASGLSVSTQDSPEIGQELVLLISRNNIIIKITHFLSREQLNYFLLSVIILPQALCFWSHWKFFVVVLIYFLGATHKHDECT